MRAIAVTTIAYQDSIGIKRLIRMSEICSAQLVLIGDKKTPIWEKKKLPSNVHFLSLDDQNQKWPTLSRLMPINHYGRKNLAYLWAIENDVEILLDTDDDNFSEFDVFSIATETYRTLDSNQEWVNTYAYFGQEKLWPRGLPLDEAMSPKKQTITHEGSPDWHCFQAIVDGDPDLDAIGRMLYPQNHTFSDLPPILLQGRQFCPTNSQATLWKKELIPLLYLPLTAPFRMTDIWRGIILAGFLKSKNYQVLFGKANFLQVRNEHDLLSDFQDEILGHTKNRFIKIISDERWSKDKNYTLMTLTKIYEDLISQSILDSAEIDILNLYLNDICEKLD